MNFNPVSKQAYDFVMNADPANEGRGFDAMIDSIPLEDRSYAYEGACEALQDRTFQRIKRDLKDVPFNAQCIILGNLIDSFDKSFVEIASMVAAMDFLKKMLDNDNPGA